MKADAVKSDIGFPAFTSDRRSSDAEPLHGFERCRAMETLTSAVLVLLACSPDSLHCREMRQADTYASLEVCRAALPETLRAMNASGQSTIGRCVSMGDDGWLDPVTTESVSEDQYATVRVTRIEDGQQVVSTYRVKRDAN